MNIYFWPGGSGNSIVRVEDDMRIKHSHRKTTERTAASIYANWSMEAERRVILGGV